MGDLRVGRITATRYLDRLSEAGFFGKTKGRAEQLLPEPAAPATFPVRPLMMSTFWQKVDMTNSTCILFAKK